MNERRALSLVLVLATISSIACKKTTAPPVDDKPPAASTVGGLTAPATTTAKSTPTTPPTFAALPANLPALPTATGKGKFALPGRAESAIEVVLPEHRPPKPPLLIAFHGTGEEPEAIVTSFDLVAKAEPLGFVAIAPRAGHRDTPHPPDVDHPENWGGSSWNMWAYGDANEDLRYVRALIEAAKKSWNADTSRVYVAGFSNGAYFSYFVAASMPDKIAGFAEMSGGWTTDACPSRTDQDGTSLYLMKTAAPGGKEVACSTILADKQLPSKCRVTATNKLRPPVPAGRVPFGYLAHYTADDGVSVAWSCLLAEGMGARAKTMIRAKEPDGTTGHYPMPDFLDGAWKFFAGRTNAQ
jgi:predicted esterase